jgi:hypothetical protein
MAEISCKAEPINPGDFTQMPLANRSTNNKKPTEPNLIVVVIDLRIIAKKVALVEKL